MPIVRACDRALRIERGLIECDFGEWTGAKLSRLQQRPEWSVVQRYPSGFRFPGGESFPEMQTRIVSTIARLMQSHPGRTIVAVSHADPIKAAVAHALGIPSTCSSESPSPPRRCPPSPIRREGPAVFTVNSLAGDLGMLGACMSESFDLQGPDHFTAGAVGPSGQRVFYVQARESGSLLTLKSGEGTRAGTGRVPGGSPGQEPGGQRGDAARSRICWIPSSRPGPSGPSAWATTRPSDRVAGGGQRAGGEDEDEEGATGEEASRSRRGTTLRGRSHRPLPGDARPGGPFRGAARAS